MQAIGIVTLGEAAKGAIGPEERIARNELSEVEVQDFAEHLQTDEFYTEVGELGPNAAGGTFSLVVADALTTQRFLQPNQTADQHAKTVYGWLMQYADTPENYLIIPRQCIDGRPLTPGYAPSKQLIGGHDSTKSKDDCGAQKRLPEILAYISNNGDVLRNVTESEGVTVDDETHALIVASSQARLDEGYCSSGLALRNSFTEVAGEACIAHLLGEHTEVAARKNRNPNITLDRDALQHEYGTAMEAFNIDAGVFLAAANVLSNTPREAAQKAIAMEYYNTATALVLAHKSMRYLA